MDDPGQLTHSNSAIGIASITLTKADFTQEIALFERLGFSAMAKGDNATNQEIKITQCWCWSSSQEITRKDPLPHFQSVLKIYKKQRKTSPANGPL